MGDRWYLNCIITKPGPHMGLWNNTKNAYWLKLKNYINMSDLDVSGTMVMEVNWILEWPPSSMSFFYGIYFTFPWD